MATLQELREQLDQIDHQMVQLYEERMYICEQVGQYKIGAGKKVFDKQREQEKLQSVAEKVSTEFQKKGIQELYQQLMSMSRQLQYKLLADAGKLEHLSFVGVKCLDTEPARIVSTGTEEAHIQMAAKKYFGDSCKYFHVHTPREVMEAIANGNADFAVLSVENSAVWAFAEGYDLLEEFDSYIVVEDNDSKKVIVVTNQKIFLEDATKIGICFELPHESGSLYRMLSHFIYNDLNMTKIESRALENGEYRFFIEFEGNLADVTVENTISELQEECQNLKILGNY